MSDRDIHSLRFLFRSEYPEAGQTWEQLCEGKWKEEDMNESDTPRTDAASEPITDFRGLRNVVPADFARQLERELILERQRRERDAEQYQHAVEVLCDLHKKDADQLRQQLAEANKENAELRNMPGQLLDVHAICDHRDQLVQERDQLRRNHRTLLHMLRESKQNLDSHVRQLDESIRQFGEE